MRTVWGDNGKLLPWEVEGMENTVITVVPQESDKLVSLKEVNLHNVPVLLVKLLKESRVSESDDM